MGDQQTKADLEALLADNTVGDITPARLRDFLESCKPSRGVLLFQSGVTAIAAASASTKATNTTTVGADAYRFEGSDGSNTLVYTGVSVCAEVLGVFGVSAAADAQLVKLLVFKNGNGEGGELVAEYSVVLGAAGALSQVCVLASVALEQDDYLEVYVSNETSDEDITIDHGSLRAAAFLT